MKNRKSYLSVIALASVATMVLAACGSTGGGNGTTADGKQVLNAMFIGGTADKALMDVVKSVADDYNSTNGHNVEIEIETYENEQYKTKLASLMASNSQPDVFFTWSSGYLKPFVQGGKVLDLTPYLDADSEWKGRFNEGVFGPVTIEDKVYAIPNGQSVAVMYYNKKIFSDQGIEVPTTYGEFLDSVKKLKAADITPISAPVKDAWIAGQLLQQSANAVGGIDLFNSISNGSRDWNDQDLISAGGMLKELADLGAFPSGYLGMTNDEGREAFLNENTAMYYMGSWEVSALSNEAYPAAGNIGVFNIPPVQGGENLAVGDVDLAYAVSAKSENADAAVDFIKLFSEPEIQQRYAYEADYLTSTNAELDPAKLNPLFAEVNALQKTLSGVTPWMDRVYGAGEGVEFNNAAQAIIAGEDPAPRLNELQKFAETNANR